MSQRDLLANDIKNLRRHSNAPTSALRELIQLNKEMYRLLPKAEPMTPQEFVEGLQLAVLEAAPESVLAALDNPPGRSPAQVLVTSGAWYRALSPSDRAQVQTVAGLVAFHAVFGILAVVDNVRTLESTPTKGRFVLSFVKDGQTWVLNPPEGEMLHDLLEKPQAAAVPK